MPSTESPVYEHEDDGVIFHEDPEEEEPENDEEINDDEEGDEPEPMKRPAGKSGPKKDHA